MAERRGAAAMARVLVRLPHVTWRDGRPRFTPSPTLRALGYRGEDLKRADGTWMALDEARAWVDAKLVEIAARRDRRAAGRRLPAVARGRVYRVEDLFDDLWTAQRFQPAAAGDRAGRLAPATVRDYRMKAAAFATFDPEFVVCAAAAVTRPIVKGLHERLWAQKGLPMANGMIAVLRLAYSEAIDRGRGGLRDNPCTRLRLPSAAARLRIGTAAELAALLAAADALDPAIGDAVVVALYTGQRQADVLQLAARNESGGVLRFIQNKTNARVRVRALPGLVARLAAAHARRPADATAATVVVDDRTGAAFNEHSFRHRFARVRAAAAKNVASVATLQFMDLRDTAVTRLALAGSTVPEIAAITGHSLETVHTILKHYLELNEQHADAAIVKLQAWMDREGIEL